MALLVLVAALFAAPQAAMAWKPFTHNFIGDQVWPQANAKIPTVGIRGNNYPFANGVAAALKAHRASYNAGVVGPDGFPDIAYGQSQIHPNHTGKWLRFLMQKAQAAQTATKKSPTTGKTVSQYTDAQKGQILAFTYGFLTHAAGDMWGHTLINDFAGGLFPSFGEFTRREKARIALRHIVAESYVGSATPGWDRAQGTRRKVCTTYTPKLTTCDISDDTTHRVQFSAPTEFIYDVFVNPKNPLPVGTCGDGIDDDGDGVKDDGCYKQAYSRGVPEPQRGPLLDYFIDLQADLEAELAELNYNKKNDHCSLLTQVASRPTTGSRRTPSAARSGSRSRSGRARPTSARPRSSAPTTRRGRSTSPSGSRTSVTVCRTGARSASGSPRRCSIPRHGAMRRTTRAAIAGTRTSIR